MYNNGFNTGSGAAFGYCNCNRCPCCGKLVRSQPFTQTWTTLGDHTQSLAVNNLPNALGQHTHSLHDHTKFLSTITGEDSKRMAGEISELIKSGKVTVDAY